RDNCPLFIFASTGEDTAFTRSDWTRGIEWWRFNLPWSDGLFSEGDGKRVLHTVLARNLLRPGETVHMKHFARELMRFGAGAPDIAKLPRVVSIVNEATNEQSTRLLTWSSRGNAVTELRLPPNAKRGLYTIRIGDVVTGRFTVADFRLPVYKAEVALPRANLASGDPAVVDVRLSFLAGGAASGDTITARSRIDTRTWEGFDAYPEHSFVLLPEPEILKAAAIDVPQSREPAGEELMLTLDATGSARVTLPTPDVAAPASLIADIEYRDPNGEVYTAQARGTVWPAERLVGIRVADWAMSRERLEWELVTTDVEGRPVGDVAFTVRGVHRSWDHYRRRNIGGFYSYASNETVQDLGVLCEGRSDRAGRARCSASVAVSGEVALIAAVSDARGRIARASTSVWAANGEDWMFRFAASDRIDLLPEKKRYEPGERARFQVRMPFREATALVTVEREGHVLWSTVTRLSGKAAVVEVPIREEWAPNAYVSALLVRGRVGEPAPTATVDLGRPAFKLGIANIDIHWKRFQLNVTVTTEKKEYRTRDRVPVKIRVERANNRRPADGSEVAVFAIDEALLELQPNPSWKLLEAMMKRRDYGVTTATAQMQVIGKRHYGRKALPPGGSGGGGVGARELFDTLVFWKADVVTDARGEASVEVPLNDSLTRFRIVAVAERADPAGDRFGTGETSVRTTRDLQLFAGIPATVRHGDVYRATVSLRNATTRPIVAEVDARRDDQPLPRREVSLAPGQTALVTWETTAPVSGRETVWFWQAREKGAPAADRGGDSLRVRQTLATPVPPRPVAAAEAEIKQGRAKLSLAGEAGTGAAAAPGAEIAVTVARTYGADTSGIRRYFENYPFACLEQRMVKAMGTKREDLWQRIVDELPDYLSPSGLAHFYPGASGEGHAVLTAFLLAGAHEAGWTLPEALRERMLYGLEGHVSGRVKTTRDWLPGDAIALVSEKLIALEALSRYDRVNRQLLDSVGMLPIDPRGAARPVPGVPGRIPLARLTAASVADWVDVLGRVKDVPNAAALRAQAIAELRQAVRVQGGLASVTRNDERWYFMRSSDYTLARMLRLSLEL
ncbi:MAG: MG2 domain-containing protein, partial [Casimicrobiaceae bacterium]